MSSTKPLLEWGKEVDPSIRMVSNVIAKENLLLTVMPFMSYEGRSYTWLREDDSVSVANRESAFRNVNEAISGKDLVGNIQETLTYRLLGDSFTVDNFLKKTSPAGFDLIQNEGTKKMKFMANKFVRTFVKGDETSDPKEFNGLKNRVTSAQTITQSAGAMTLAKLDETMDAVMGGTNLLIMNKIARRKLETLVSTNTSVWDTITLAQFGASFDVDLVTGNRHISRYKGVPIIVFDDSSILDYSEPTSTTSIYAIRLGEDGVFGVQSTPPSLEEPVRATNGYTHIIEWYVNFVVANPRVIARYSNITTA
jgi:hypothetical protein